MKDNQARREIREVKEQLEKFRLLTCPSCGHETLNLYLRDAGFEDAVIRRFFPEEDKARFKCLTCGCIHETVISEKQEIVEPPIKRERNAHRT